jgi:transketolase
MAELVGMRPAYGETLVQLGHADPRVVALNADVKTSDFSYLFGDEFPGRYFNVGIAEQSLIDVSVGLAATGLIPFPNTFAVFFASRALEPVLTHLCYDEVPVKMMAGYCGLSPAFEGPTHHAITDVAVMRALPNMTIVAPADPTALRKLLPQVKDWPGPVYFRFNRNEVPAIFGADYEPVIGRAVPLREGSDVTFIANGQLVARSLEAADGLAEQGINAGVLEIHTIKPLDVEAIVRASRTSGAIVAAEEHVITGGLGSAVAEVLAEAGTPVALRRVGIADTFAESGPYYPMLDKYGMSVEHLIKAAHAAIEARRAPVAV